MDKKELRKDLRKKAKSLDKEYKDKASKGIFENIISLPEFIAAKCVFLYLNTENEPQTADIIAKCFELQKKVCVPVCLENADMVAVILRDFSGLGKNKYGILEPPLSENIVQKDLIDFAVIPCVSADKTLKRIGHGAGYYDRYLSKTCFYKVSICFDKMMSENIPTDRYDVLMDCIVTENRVYKKD